MKTTLVIGALMGVLLGTSAAIAHPGLSLGIDTGLFDGSIKSSYHEVYNKTTYDDVYKHNVTAKYIGLSAQYDFVLYDGAMGQLDSDLHTYYLFNIGGSAAESNNYDAYTYRFGNKAGGGVGIKWRNIAGWPVSLGIAGDWVNVSLVTKDVYAGNDYVSFNHKNANGFSWGPTIGWDITTNWSLEGRVAFTSLNASSDTGHSPNDVWTQSSSARGTYFGLRLSHDFNL